MTLVQTSIANRGGTVVILADRLLTNTFGEDFPMYESEGNSPKIFLKKNVGIGFAGSAIYADMAISSLPSDISDFDEIVKIISDFVKDTRNSEIEQEVFRVARLSAKEFFSNTIHVPDVTDPVSAQVPEAVRDYLYGWISDFEFEFDCIVAGFDKDENAKIVEITGDGDKINLTTFGMGSIGTGLVFSQIYFDQHQYEISIPETEGLFFAYKAKKRAEAHTGVGSRTDMLLLIVKFLNNRKLEL